MEMKGLVTGENGGRGRLGEIAIVGMSMGIFPAGVSLLGDGGLHQICGRNKHYNTAEDTNPTMEALLAALCCSILFCFFQNIFTHL
jgi:hypothetical protein